MQSLKIGHIRLIDGEDLQDFGQPIDQENSIILRVHDPRFYTLCCVQGSNGAAKAYINGYWSSPQLSQLLADDSRQPGSPCHR